jgi:adenylate cyclase
MYKTLQRFVSEGKRLPIFLGILLTFFVLWLHVGAPVFVDSLIQRLEYLVYDQRLYTMPKAVKGIENKIIIVDLDERSLQAEGQYPWNRIKVGQLVEKLRDDGALVVGFDITFPEADRNIRDLLESIDLTQLDDSFSETLALLEPQINSDQYFANAMQSGVDVVLAINFNPQSDATYNDLPPSIVDIGDEMAGQVSLLDMSGYTGNLKLLQDAALGNGSMNQQPDIDGIVRRVPLVIRYGTNLYPTLSLEMIRVYNFAESYELVTQQYGGAEVVTAIRVGEGAGAYEIPTDGFAQVNVPYVGTSSLGNNQNFPYISATDVLNDTLSAEEQTALENSLVLVGTSAPGLGDTRATPLQQAFPGVEVHANMLNALLDSVTTVDVESGDSSTESAFADFQRADNIYFPYKPDWESGAMFAAIVILGVGMSLTLPFFGAGSMATAAALLIVASIWANFQLWVVYKMDFSLVLLLLVILLITGANMIYGFLNESQTRKAIKGMFDQYVPPAHIDHMLEDPDNYSFEGESKQLTVLFSDIRSFTTISEALTATQLKTLLNEFFTPITGLIFDNNGTIDKYVGDMVMAFWGAPLDDEKHRYNAVVAGLEIVQKVEDLKVEFKAKGLPEVNVGVGINTGMMNVGDMGSTYRRSYTVLGDAVNLGSRLEGLTKFYGIRLLIGEDTARDLDGFLLRLIDRVKVKGKDKAIDCFEPLCLEQAADEELREKVKRFHEALDDYHDKRWDAADTKMRALLEQEPGCKLYQIYIERIETLRETPLPEDWDGAFTHTSK